MLIRSKVAADNLTDMRYIDSGSRNPQDALGTWLGSELIGVTPPAALRVQTGFFGSDALGYFDDALTALEQTDGHTRFLVGSNDGQTPRGAVADLLAVAGQPRIGMRLGVVSFQTGYFHTKIVHIRRADGSSTACVGSANLTGSGITSLHVEAGIVLDSKAGDPEDVLDSIAHAVDAWFTPARPGLYEVATNADLDALVQANVLGVAQPSRPKRTVHPAAKPSGAGATAPGHSLKPLVAAPPVQTPLPAKPSPGGGGASPAAGGGTSSPGDQQTSSATPASPSLEPATPTPPSKATAAKHWGKTLSDSDAQRKKTGNQRGAITLVQGDYRGRIDQTNYFRTELFSQLTWVPDMANTGAPIETATVPMNVTIDGNYYGTLDFKITNGTSRESAQNNYTAELHVEPIGQIIKQNNISGKHLDVTLDADGDYWLTIS